MVRNLSYEEIGHEEHPERFPALSPDYVESDIGNFDNLTCTVFGYQIDEEAALRMTAFLCNFLADSIQSRNILKQ